MIFRHEIRCPYVLHLNCRSYLRLLIRRPYVRFPMRPRISIGGSVRPYVRAAVRPLASKRNRRERRFQPGLVYSVIMHMIIQSCC